MATLLNKEAKTSVEPLSANLFEVVLLEISDTSEKFDIGSRFQVPLVLGSRQLDSAQIIGDLREPVQFGGRRLCIRLPDSRWRPR